MEHYCAAVSLVSLSSQYAPGPLSYLYLNNGSIKAKETRSGLKALQKGHKIQQENLITLEDLKIKSSIIETSSGKDGLVGFHVFSVPSIVNFFFSFY